MCGLTFIAPAAAFADDINTAEVFFVRGGVYLEDNYSEVPLQKGDKIDEGDTVVTAENSLVIIRLSDGSKLKINQNSKMTFEQIIARIDKESVGQTSLVMQAGSAIFDVKNKRKEPKLEVKTKTVAMGVRGTRFFAGFDPSINQTWTSVNRGEIEIYDPENRKTKADVIEAGRSMLVDNREFSRPAQYEWQQQIDFDVNNNTQGAPKLKAMRVRFRQNIQNTKREWRPRPGTMADKRRVWQSRRQVWQQRTEKFKDRVHNLREQRREQRPQKIRQMRQSRSEQMQSRSRGQRNNRISLQRQRQLRQVRQQTRSGDDSERNLSDNSDLKRKKRRRMRHQQQQQRRQATHQQLQQRIGTRPPPDGTSISSPTGTRTPRLPGTKFSPKKPGGGSPPPPPPPGP